MAGSLSLLGLAQGAAALLFAWTFADALYKLYFSPLAKIPGPKLYAISKLPWLYAWITGDSTHLLTRFHKKYGPVVRYSPNEISFTSSQAWNDIYGAARNKIFLKDKAIYRTPADGEDYLVVAQDHAVHARQRRILSQAFSDKALREQEPILKMYIDLLISKLQDHAGTVVNLVEWYNWTVFDLIGDLAYGEPFGCLEKGQYHRWVLMIFESVKGFAFLTAAKKLAPLDSLLKMMIPKKTMEAVKWREQTGREKFERRLQKKTDRKDFFSYILNQDNKLEMTHGELVHNSGLLIVAGSETTATLLSGATYLLLKHPDCLKKLVDEIRSTYKDEAEITMSNVGSLSYLGAVINEAGRIYPPTPFNLGRVAAEDVIVDGQFLPKGVRAIQICRTLADFLDICEYRSIPDLS
jgi:cytochrome P450